MKWISVDERLPEVEDGRVLSCDVLVFCSNGMAFVGCYDYEYENWAFTKGQPTHWMPIEPPEDV